MCCRGVALLTLVVLAASVASACGESDGVDVRVGGLTIEAEVARTTEERAQGLSGRDSLARDRGMLFIFEDDGRRGFWMRGMRFPLDFIWISAGGRVVDLTENVPPPSPGVKDADLQLYRPAGPVRYVLEVNAGVVRKEGIEVGDEVTFEPEITRDEGPVSDKTPEAAEDVR